MLEESKQLSTSILKMFNKCEADYKRAHTPYTPSYYSYPNYGNYGGSKKKDDATHILYIVY